MNSENADDRRVTCGADFGALIRKQYDEYGRVIRDSSIKAD